MRVCLDLTNQLSTRSPSTESLSRQETTVARNTEEHVRFAYRMSWKLATVAIVVFAYIYHTRLDRNPINFLSHLTSNVNTSTDSTDMSTKAKALFLLEAKGQYAVQDKVIPEPGPGEVLVQIYATALNPVDWKVRSTYSFLVSSYPHVGGTDGAGVIEEVGAEVSNFAKGDRV